MRRVHSLFFQLYCFTAVYLHSKLCLSNTNAMPALKLLSIAKKNIASHHHAHAHGNSTSAYPYATIAYAQTIDGSIAPSSKKRISISSETSFHFLHSLRKYHDAVLIGINTLIIDKPMLNVRHTLPGIDIPAQSDQPRAVVLDTDLKILTINEMKLVKPIVVTSVPETDERFSQAREYLCKYGGMLISVPRCSSGSGCDLEAAFMKLKKHQINSILVEGGAMIIHSALATKLCHQVIVTIYPGILGGYRSMQSELADMASLRNVSVAVVGGDIIVLGEVEHVEETRDRCISSCCGDDTGSADLVFARTNINVINQD
jgi:riboflavin-specific deaminase-like protein